MVKGNQSVMMKQRLEYIDLAKGFAMLMVVYIHISINYADNPFADSWVRRMMGSMFMPIFFIMSGFFFSVKQPFRDWVKKKTKRLIVPFLVFYLLTYLMNCVLCGLLHVQTKNEFHYGDLFQVFFRDVFANNVIWFLLALFWSSVILYVIAKNCRSRIWQTLLVVILGGGGKILGDYELNIQLYIDTALTALPFVYIGYLVKEYEVLARVSVMPKNKRITLMLLVFVIGFILDYFFGQGASMVNNMQPSASRFYGCGVVGSLSVLALSNMIGKLPLISFVGRHSILVLCTQMYLINLFVKLTNRFFGSLGYYPASLLVLLLVCVSYYALVPLVNRYVPWIIGEKK